MKVTISDNNKHCLYQWRYNYSSVYTAASYSNSSATAYSTGYTAAADKPSSCGGSTAAATTAATTTATTAAGWWDPDSTANSYTKWRDSADSSMCSLLLIIE
jgi:hypothetical protein